MFYLSLSLELAALVPSGPDQSLLAGIYRSEDKERRLGLSELCLCSVLKWSINMVLATLSGCYKNGPKNKVIGASLSEPHTSMTALLVDGDCWLLAYQPISHPFWRVKDGLA